MGHSCRSGNRLVESFCIVYQSFFADLGKSNHTLGVKDGSVTAMTEEELLQVIEQAASEGWTELDLSGNELTVLPPEIGTLTELKKLILGKYQYHDGRYIVGSIGNKLSALPAQIGQLNQLEELQVVDNRLSALPNEIGQLTSLQSLDLSGNQLSTLPAEIKQLPNLITLKHYVILKPEWGTTAVYNVLDNDTVLKNLGCFTQENLEEIWKDSEYADMRDELLQLMMRFKLCYPIPNRSCHYIAPQLLDINQPKYTWDNSNNLILRYTYEFMPKGILTRFIVETHPWIEQQTLVWRSGVILNKDQTRAEVIEHYNQREIKVRVTGSRKKELLAVVTHELEKIHNSYERLKYQTFVPCNCEDCQGSQTPYSYPLDKLRKRLEAGKYRIECENSYEMVDVRRLIDDVNLQSLSKEQEISPQITSLQLQLQQEREESMNRPSALKFEKEIFISYAWGGESEQFVNNLDQTLQAKGIKIIRDKRDLGYKGLIKAFMERIGRGKCVIAVISDKYLKSPNCMFELVQVSKNGELYDRIFPIVLEDAQIYKPTARLKYIKHWEDEIKELDEAMRGVGAANLQGFRDDIDQYTDIRNAIAELTNLLKDMNTLTPDIHSESEFETLINAIEQRLDDDIK